MKKIILAMTALLIVLAGCTTTTTDVATTPTVEPSAEVTATPTPEPSPEPTETVEKALVNFAVLTGPSGVGGVKLIADSEAGETRNDYGVTIATANDEVVAGLTSGDIDIAAMASNLAANLYNKTDGSIQVAAVSGLGVLYILENGETVRDMDDLEGKTLYATGQGANPEFALNYLLEKSGVSPDDVDIQWRAADEITTLMVSGEAQLCMMPVPASTAIMMKNTDVREALNLSEEWDDLSNGSRLTMTTLVVRTEFAQENPRAVIDFLADYQESVDFMNSGDEGAAQLVADYGIAASAAIAQAAIPKCALVCITGADNMMSAIQGYYEVLWQADPTSIGGGIPDDGFYFDVQAG